VAEGRAGYWINEKALAFLSASNNFESDDQMASLGLLIRR
jgi:hypothetical protein